MEDKKVERVYEKRWRGKWRSKKTESVWKGISVT